MLDGYLLERHAKIHADKLDGFLEEFLEEHEGPMPKTMELTRHYFEHLKLSIPEYKGVDAKDVKTTNTLGGSLFDLVKSKTKHLAKQVTVNATKPQSV